MGKKTAAAAAGGGEAAQGNQAENIKVLVRCRPLNSRELENNYKSCVDLDLADATVQVNHVCGAPDRWTFDAVVNNTMTQRDVFTQFIMPLVDSVLDGFNATVFAYGQSGSGKTHTMTGKYDDAELMGIIPRSFRYVFEYIRQAQERNPTRHFTLYCSFIELYNGKVRDLLAKTQVTLNVKENKDKTFYVQGAQVPQVKFPEDLIRLMEEGTDRRQVAATELNADSSRSHSVFTLLIESMESGDDGDTRSVTSKFNLVDLAGSERQSKTGAQGDTLKEGCNINLSLSALGTVIDTIVKGKGHVPFRSSPLTMLLKDSLGGSSKTVMFANIGPSEHNLSETVSTLRFADRAKQIKNKPVVNMDSKDQKIAELTEMVAALKEKLKALETGDMERLETEVEELREKCAQLEIDLDNAVKGREADRIEGTQARDALTMEMRDIMDAKTDAEGRLSALQQELAVSQQAEKDVNAQRDEVWRLCSQYLKGEPVTSIEELEVRLKPLEGNVSADEFARVSGELKRLTAEMDAATATHEAEVAQLKASELAAREELDQVTKKLDRVKDKFEREKEARRQLIETQESAGFNQTLSGAASAAAMSPGAKSASERDNDSHLAATWLHEKHSLENQHRLKVHELEAEIERLSDMMGQDPSVPSVGPVGFDMSPVVKGQPHHHAGNSSVASESPTATRQSTSMIADAHHHGGHAMIKEKDDHIRELTAQLDASSRALEASAQGVGDSKGSSAAAVGNLQLVLNTKNEALARARKDIERLEAQLLAKAIPGRKKKGADGERRAAGSPPAAAAGVDAVSTGGCSSSTAAVDTLDALQQHHQEQRGALWKELQHTAEHRDQLLQAVLDSSAADPTGSTAPGGVMSDEAARKHIAQLLAEVKLLREKAVQDQARVDSAMSKEHDIARLKQQIQDQMAQHASVVEGLKENFGAESEAFQQQLVRAENEAAAKESSWLSALQEGSSDDQAKAIIDALRSEKAVLLAEKQTAQNDLRHALQELMELRSQMSQSTDGPPATAPASATGPFVAATAGPFSESPMKRTTSSGELIHRGGGAATAVSEAFKSLLQPLESDSPHVVELKEKLLTSLKEHSESSAGGGALARTVSGRRGSAMLSSMDANVLCDLRAKSAVLEVEKAELRSELEAAKQELLEAVARVDGNKKDVASLHEEAAQRSRDLAAAKLLVAQSENRQDEPRPPRREPSGERP